MKSLFGHIFLVHIFLTLVISPPSAKAQSDIPSPIVEVEYVSSTGTSLGDLVAGMEGEGILRYYSKVNESSSLRLIVHIFRKLEDTVSTAEIYEVLAGSVEYVDQLSLDPDGATIIIKALDGWWVRNNLVNYNLDVEIRSPVTSMWSGSWVKTLTPGVIAAKISIRDTNNDGKADWDFRSMVPELKGEGYPRATYAESKCITPETVDLGVFPDWPYVAIDGGFEQQPGRFRPPIVVDWEVGGIKYFSEVVTVRNQNCSYSFYSLSPLFPDQLNQLDFETPFAFYDLSEVGTGYPNLIFRTERWPHSSAWIGGPNPEHVTIRISWRYLPGDWIWDYKVGVVGLHRYNNVTSIADGLAAIDAPSYESFPTWAISKNWPVVTFVGREGNPSRSSEGIYEWSAAATGMSYYFGLVNEPLPEAYADITEGFRGEYSLHKEIPLKMYFSPVDNRLHLKWAEQGLWRLDEAQVVRVFNLDDDKTVDYWTRELLPVRVEAEDETASGIEPAEPVVIEALYALDGLLLHLEGNNLTLKSVIYEPILFEMLPPTDHESWEQQRRQLAVYEDQRRDPLDFASWLDAFPGKSGTIKGASVANVRSVEGGFRFELRLEPEYQIIDIDTLGIGNLPAGDYLVEKRDGVFDIKPLIPPQLTLEVERPGEDSTSASVWVTLSNQGQADATGLTVVMDVIDSRGGIIELNRKRMDALAGESTRYLANVSPGVAKVNSIRFRLEDQAGQTLTEAYLPVEENIPSVQLAAHVFGLSADGGYRSSWLIVLVLFAIIPLVVFLNHLRGNASMDEE